MFLTVLKGTGAGSNQPGKPSNTRKKFKANLLISIIIFWAAIIWHFAVAGQAGAQFAIQSAVSSLLIFIGMSWYVITKAIAWYHSKPKET